MQKSQLVRYINKIAFLMFLYVVVVSCGSHILIKVTTLEQSDYTLRYTDGIIQQLSVVCNNGICNFIVIDTLGMPIVSKEYRDNKFKNTKFLPPNKQYDMLFAYIVETKGKDSQFEFKIGNKTVTVYKNK